MRSRLTVLCFLILLLSQVQLRAQSARQPLISASYNNATISQLVNDIEKATDFHFFYDPLQMDSLRINGEFNQVTVSKLLGQIFTNTEYHFLVDGQQIILTRGKRLFAGLPEGFATSRKAIDIPSEGLAEPVTARRKQPAAVLENKVYEIGSKASESKSASVSLVGYIRDTKTGEPVPGVSITIEQLKTGVASDQYGFYSLTIPKGRHVLNIQSLGKRDSRRQVQVWSDGKLDIELQEQIIALKEVVISASKASNIKSLQLGTERLNITTIRQVPTVFGEADVLRVVLTLPGVKTVGEASTGFNVRGGSTDQNLILYNDATIYNPAHFFGFFSAFNPDIVKDIELYKGSIPSKYGGRLSSVLDINSREGNKKNFAGSAGLGLLTSRVSLEGPIQKDKTSFILGARTTYANWLINKLPDEYKNSKASFYDVDFHITHQVDKKNSLFFNGYLSKDKFNLNSDTAYGYRNNNASVKWKHVFSNKLNSVFVAALDRYDYQIGSTANKINAYKLAFDINQLSLKGDFNYYLDSKHTIDFGFSSIRYLLHPGSFKPATAESQVLEDIVPAEHALESAVYVGDRYTVNSKLSFNLGLRYSIYNYLGPHEISNYADGLPRTDANRVGTKTYSNGKTISTYQGPEYRASARYAFREDLSLKAGVNSLRQYIHMLSNTAAIAPTDIWKLSDPNIKPQMGTQYSLGVYKNFKSNTIETSVEVYYKDIRNYLDFKSGAVLVMNPNIETDVINTRGKAYGLELMLKKQTGKFNGWISYTFSRTFLKVDDPIAGETINLNEYYPSNYDKPHDLTFIGNYRFTHRLSLSFNATYSTGRPITLPVGRYYYGGSYRVIYSDRNAYRIPDYFRTDLSLNVLGNHKVKQKTHNSWTFGFYNVTGRKNPYSVYFISENGLVKGYKLSIFGSIIPFVNYNINF